MGSNYVILEYTLKINNFCLASFETLLPDSSFNRSIRTWISLSSARPHFVSKCEPLKYTKSPLLYLKVVSLKREPNQFSSVQDIIFGQLIRRPPVLYDMARVKTTRWRPATRWSKSPGTEAFWRWVFDNSPQVDPNVGISHLWWMATNNKRQKTLWSALETSTTTGGENGQECVAVAA